MDSCFDSKQFGPFPFFVNQCFIWNFADDSSPILHQNVDFFTRTRMVFNSIMLMAKIRNWSADKCHCHQLSPVTLENKSIGVLISKIWAVIQRCQNTEMLTGTYMANDNSSLWKHTNATAWPATCYCGANGFFIPFVFTRRWKSSKTPIQPPLVPRFKSSS